MAPGMDQAPTLRDPASCNPVTLETLRGAIRAAQAEMEALLERTATSAFIRKEKDFYTALFDAEGRLAVGSNVPIFGDVAAPVLARFPAAAVLDATATDDQAAGPVNFLMNPHVPGTALGLFFLGGDPSQVCNARGPAALDEIRLREGSLLQPRFPAPWACAA